MFEPRGTLINLKFKMKIYHKKSQVNAHALRLEGLVAENHFHFLSPSAGSKTHDFFYHGHRHVMGGSKLPFQNLNISRARDLF